jgi:MFS family permease
MPPPSSPSPSLDVASSVASPPPGATGRLTAIGVLALWIMAPVTLPVPVLRELVQDRFLVSEFLTSAFMSINMVGALLAAPLAGYLSDRFGRRKPLLVGALVIDALCFLALTAPLPFTAFLAIRFFEGCAHISALSILLIMASRALPSEHRGRAMGVAGSCMMLGIAFGAPLGGMLGRSGPLLPLQVGAALTLAGAVLASLLREHDHVEDERPSTREILSSLRAQPALFAPLAFAFADRFTVGFFTTTFSLYVGRIHGLESAQIGALIATFMIPFAILSYPFGRIAERFSITVLLCVGSLLYGVGTAFVGFTAPPELFFLMFGVGITAAVMFVPSMVLTTQLAPAEIRGAALGAFNAAGSLGFILGPLTGGAISQAVAAQSGWLVGYRAAFIAAGLSEVLCVMIALPFLLRLRRQDRST